MKHKYFLQHIFNSVTDNSNRSFKQFKIIAFLLLFGIYNGFGQGASCATAETLTLNGACDSNNITDNVEDLPYNTCGGTFRREGWYTFTVTGGSKSVTITAIGNRNLAFQLMSSTSSCSGLLQISCINNQLGSAGNDSTETTTQLLGNGIYYVKVLNVGADNNMNLTSICVTSIVPENTVPATGNNSYSLCSGNLYDSGGSAVNYATNSDGYTILNPSVPGNLVRVSGSITAESGYDYLTIYEGSGTAGTILWGGSAHGTGTSCGTFVVPTITSTTGPLTVRFRSDGSTTCSGLNLVITCITPAVCSGTPAAGAVAVSPPTGQSGSLYNVTAAGFTTSATGLTFQWQYSTNGGGAWTNQGTATGTYANLTATAPALGTTVLWHLIVTCTASGQSATSTNGTFSSVNTLNIPATGNNSVACGTNIVLYDNGGSAGNYVNNSNGYTVLEAGLGATINISGNYVTEFADDIVIYNGTGIGGTVLATYNGTGSINYTGTPGQTISVQFTSDGSVVYSGFTLSVSYTGVCFPVCTGTPTGGTVSTSPNTAWPTTPYIVSATGYTQALNMTYQWQFSTTGTGGPWTNAGAASGTYSNYNATAPASGNVNWQLIVTCSNSGISSTSTTGLFVTMTTSTVVTGCPNVVSGGLGLNGADPVTITCSSSTGCVDLEATYLDLGDTTSYIVEPIAYNPPFPFSGLANPVSVNIDDKWSPIVNLPFDFCFYGNTYNSCTIGSNGILSFNTSLAGGSSGYSFSNNIPISGNTVLVENAIFGVFHDINPRISGEIGWELITLPTGCRALVASWNQVPLFGDNAQFYTGMMVLYENSNIIEIYIKNKPNDPDDWNDNNAIVGIQNANGTLASVAPGRNGLDPNWTATNEAWRFVPNGTSIASIKWYEGSGITGSVAGTTDVISVCPTTTTTYTAEITYTLCDGRTITEIDETTVTVNKEKTWNGSSSTDWNTAANWTPSGVPTATQAVSIPNVPNKPIISAVTNALACSIDIASGSSLTINPDRSIIVTNAVAVATGATLNVLNSASLIQTNNVANSGIMNMQRTANIRKLDYVYWSSPVKTSFSSGAISTDTPAGFVYKWVPTITGNINGFGNWNYGTENMISGKGYIVRGPNSFTGTVAPFTATFIGTPANGTITTPIQRGTYNGANYSTGVSTTPGTKDDDNWNLVGNPYPSAIRAIDFLTQNTNINGFVNIWTHGTLPSATIADPFYSDYAYNYTTSDYISYNSSGASSGPGTFNGFIAAGQGFFVSMNNSSLSASETVTFNNTMRSNTYNNGQFFRNAQNPDTNAEGRIWLDLVAENGSNIRSLVAYVDGATNEKDRLFDAFTDDKVALNLYSTIDIEMMKIQGKAIPFNENDIVPMGITVPQSGTYSLAIAAVDGLFTPSTQNIYLEDKLNNVMHNLKQNPYSFTANSGKDANRFVLRYTDQLLATNTFAIDAANVFVVSAEDLKVKSSGVEIKSIRVFDMLGKELSNMENINKLEVNLTNIQKNKASLILQITLTNGAVFSKKTIY